MNKVEHFFNQSILNKGYGDYYKWQVLPGIGAVSSLVEAGTITAVALSSLVYKNPAVDRHLGLMFLNSVANVATGGLLNAALLYTIHRSALNALKSPFAYTMTAAKNHSGYLLGCADRQELREKYNWQSVPVVGAIASIGVIAKTAFRSLSDCFVTPTDMAGYKLSKWESSNRAQDLRVLFLNAVVNVATAGLLNTALMYLRPTEKAIPITAKSSFASTEASSTQDYDFDDRSISADPIDGFEATTYDNDYDFHGEYE